MRPLLTKTCLPVRQVLLIMKLTVVLLIAACLQLHAEGYAQKLSVNEKNVPVQKIFKIIEQQTAYHFFYKDELLLDLGTVNVDVKNATVEALLDECLKQLSLAYVIIEKTIIIKKKVLQRGDAIDASAPAAEIKGQIRDNEGNPLAGASVKNRRTGKGIATDTDGAFSIEAEINDVLEITSVGFEAQTVKITSVQQVVNISLKVAVAELENTVIVAYGSQ